MTDRVRECLEDTRGDTFELVRHFLARFFDTGTGATASDGQKVAIGLFASLASVWIIGFSA